MHQPIRQPTFGDARQSTYEDMPQSTYAKRRQLTPVKLDILQDERINRRKERRFKTAPAPAYVPRTLEFTASPAPVPATPGPRELESIFKTPGGGATSQFDRDQTARRPNAPTRQGTQGRIDTTVTGSQELPVKNLDGQLASIGKEVDVKLTGIEYVQYISLIIGALSLTFTVFALLIDGTDSLRLKKTIVWVLLGYIVLNLLSLSFFKFIYKHRFIEKSSYGTISISALSIIASISLWLAESSVPG